MSDLLKNLTSAISSDSRIAKSYLEKTIPDQLEELNTFTLDIQRNIKYEEGKVRIAHFLEEKIKAFSDKNQINNALSVLIDNVNSSSLKPSFRKLNRITNEDAEKILLYSDLLKNFKRKEHVVDNIKTTNPIIYATHILELYNIKEPEHIDLEGIIGDLGVFVDSDDMNSSEGRLVVKDNKAVISIEKTIEEEGKKRFIKAHELGHFMLHRKKKPLFLCDSKDFNNWFSNTNIEVQANQFAAELLMPETIFKNVFSNAFSLNEILRVKEIFNTTITATTRRYLEVGEEPICMIFFKKGKKPWASSSKHFEFEDFDISEPPKNSLTNLALNFSNQISNDEVNDIHAEQWFPYSVNGNPKRILHEQCVQMPKYDTVLTLLW